MSGVEVAVVAGALAAASTIAKSYGEYQESRYQSRVMNANADIMKHNAQMKRLETSLNEDTEREMARRQLAKNEAAMIEQGNTSPTGIGVLGQQATDLEQNILNSRYQGLALAEAMDIEANYQKQNAKATKRQARNKFFTDLIFTAPSNAFSAYAGMGGTTNPAPRSVPQTQTFKLSDNRRYEAWSKK